MDSEKFAADLTILLNRYGLDKEYDIPDWVLSHFVVGSLKTFGDSTKRRDLWFNHGEGIDRKPKVSRERRTR